MRASRTRPSRSTPDRVRRARPLCPDHDPSSGVHHVNDHYRARSHRHRHRRVRAGRPAAGRCGVGRRGGAGEAEAGVRGDHRGRVRGRRRRAPPHPANPSGRRERGRPPPGRPSHGADRHRTTGAAASRPHRWACPSRARAARSRPARLLCAPTQLPVQQQRPPRFTPRPQAAPSRRPWTGSGRTGVRRHHTSTAGGCTSPAPAPRPHGALIRRPAPDGLDPTRDPHNGPSARGTRTPATFGLPSIAVIAVTAGG